VGVTLHHHIIIRPNAPFTRLSGSIATVITHCPSKVVPLHVILQCTGMLSHTFLVAIAEDSHINSRPFSRHTLSMLDHSLPIPTSKEVRFVGPHALPTLYTLPSFLEVLVAWGDLL
jgi:hypothetical protein